MHKTKVKITVELDPVHDKELIEVLESKGGKVHTQADPPPDGNGP